VTAGLITKEKLHKDEAEARALMKLVRSRKGRALEVRIPEKDLKKLINNREGRVPEVNVPEDANL